MVYFQGLSEDVLGLVIAQRRPQLCNSHLPLAAIETICISKDPEKSET